MTVGFNGAVFLTDSEHATYLKRMPVRYLKQRLQTVCSVCGKPAMPDNPFERSHRVPFGVGIKLFKLTPDWLDGDHNIVTAHRRLCNKKAELSVDEMHRVVATLK